MNHLLSIFAAARFLGITSQELAAFVENDSIPHVELPGRRIRFDVRDLAEWTDGLKRPSRQSQSEPIPV